MLCRQQIVSWDKLNFLMSRRGNMVFVVEGLIRCSSHISQTFCSTTLRLQTCGAKCGVKCNTIYPCFLGEHHRISLHTLIFLYNIWAPCCILYVVCISIDKAKLDGFFCLTDLIFQQVSWNTQTNHPIITVNYGKFKEITEVRWEIENFFRRNDLSESVSSVICCREWMKHESLVLVALKRYGRGLQLWIVFNIHFLFAPKFVWHHQGCSRKTCKSCDEICTLLSFSFFFVEPKNALSFYLCNVLSPI